MEVFVCKVKKFYAEYQVESDVISQTDAEFCPREFASPISRESEILILISICSCYPPISGDRSKDRKEGGGGRESRSERGGFFHQKIIKVFYGDDGFGGAAVRSVNVRG